MARSAECRCSEGLTCEYCLRNAKPWFFTVTETIRREKVPKIPRDQVCWYCKQGDHAHCADLRSGRVKLCACYPCRTGKDDEG